MVQKLFYLFLILILKQISCDSPNETTTGLELTTLLVNSLDSLESMPKNPNLMRNPVLTNEDVAEGRIRPNVNLKGEPDDESNEQPIDICSDPVIYTIDRMTNGSVWIYRDRYYWQLNGLPDNETVLEGPFPIWWEGMSPIKAMSLVMTKTTGEAEGTTFRFRYDQFWAYNRIGMLYIGAPDPNLGRKFVTPIGGLTAVLFNHDTTDPLMIGFRGISVYYYRFQSMKWKLQGRDNGYVQGRDGENFPGDLDAAFSIPATNPEDGYIAYLFKGKKYCKRTKILKSGKTCDEWKPNKELFGCNRKSSQNDINDDVFDVRPPDIGPKMYSLTDQRIGKINGSKSVELSLQSLVLISILIFLY